MATELRETFDGVFFPEAVIRKAFDLMPHEEAGSTSHWGRATVEAGSRHWGFDSEDEFFAEYNGQVDSAQIYAAVERPPGPGEVYTGTASLSLNVFYNNIGWPKTEVTVTADTHSHIFRVLRPFRTTAEENRLPVPAAPAPQPLKIFIGHGRSNDWRDLKDALQDHHGYDVETFESKPRAGLTIPDVIEGMASDNTLALMILTAEDEQPDGKVRARENVVHEVGYFQGRFGRQKAILLLEEGVNEFSNIHGIVHVPYKNIREVEGQVLAIIKREFPHLAN